MINFWITLSVILISGAFGGLVFGVFTRNSYKIRIPFSGTLLEIGFLGDILVGMAASITIFFIAGPLFNFKIENINNPECYIKIIALGVLSGFTGIRLLTGMSSKLLEKISAIDQRLDEVEKSDKISELLRQADFLLNNNPDRALIIYTKALQIAPENEPGLIGKAKALRRQNRWDEAIAILSEIIKKNPNAERAYYNRACYKNQSEKYPLQDTLADLQKAISLFDFYKSYAKDDVDFKNLLSNDEFAKIVGA